MDLQERGIALNANFVDMLKLAADISGIPMAQVTSYDNEEIRVEHQHGFSGTPAISFCAHTIRHNTLLEVPDASQDDRFNRLPEVIGVPYVRFYIGVPLISPTGKRLGTLALLDQHPRTLDDQQRRHITTLARQAMVYLELHREHAEMGKLAKELDHVNAQLREQTEHLKQAQHIAHIGSWKYLINEDYLHLSDEINNMYGLPPSEHGMTLQDFLELVHPDDRRAIEQAKDDALREGYGRAQCRVIRKDDGGVRHVEIIAQMFRETNGQYYLAGTTQDITAQKATEEQIRRLAYFDQLTGLPNRQCVIDRIERVMAMHRRMVYEGAVLFIDLDNFKTLNDTHGHDIGDLLLKQVAQRLQSCVRQYDCVGRFGGDEFVILLEDIGEGTLDGATHALHVAQKILATLNEPYALDSVTHRTTPSIGIALIDGEMLTTAELLKRADMAMYEAKAEGRNAIRFFSPQMQEEVNARAELEADLRQALAEGDFYLDYQPQVDDHGHINGVEALLRWWHPTRGQMSPGEFIPVAEDLGLITEIGVWLLREACQQIVRWSQIEMTRDLILSVNVSARQFHHSSFVAQIKAALAETGADPTRLKIELTESAVIRDMEDTRHKMTELKSMGISFSLDDFGTGYSSLAYLQQLPLDQLKIDQSFVHHLITNKNDAAITRSIIALAHNLGLSVIAEGVETEDQRKVLAEQGCENFQGYLYHRPLAAHAVETQVLTRKNLH